MFPGISEEMIRLVGQVDNQDNLAIFLINSLHTREINPEILFDQEFLVGVTVLLNGSVDWYTFAAWIKKADGKSVFIEKIKDETFQQAVLALHAPDNRLKSDILLWDRTVYAHPNFLKNASVLKKHNLDYFDPLNAPEMFTVNNLDDFLSVVLQSVDEYRIKDFVSETASDEQAWNTVQELVAEYAGKDQALKLLTSLNTEQLNDSEFLAFFQTVVENSDSDITALFELNWAFVKSQTGTDMIDLLQNLPEFLAVQSNLEVNPVVKTILEGNKDIAYGAVTNTMNELHDGTPGERLQVLEGLPAKILYEVMLSSGKSVYLSTFRLLYNGNEYNGPETQNSFMSKVVAEHGSLFNFITTVKPSAEEFNTLLQQIVQNNLLVEFFADLGTVANQQEIIRTFLFETDTSITKDKAVSIGAILQGVESEELRDIIVTPLRDMMTGEAVDKNSQLIAGLLLTEHYLKATVVPDWAKPLVEANSQFFRDVTHLEAGQVFRMEGRIAVNIQHHFFYDDRKEGSEERTWDGHNSFRHFIETNGGSVVWDNHGNIQSVTIGKDFELIDKDDYVIITKYDEATKRKVVIYANKPDVKKSIVVKVHTDLMVETQPQGIVHRGHSYHADDTVRALTSGVAWVNLGSCGSAKEISEVLAKVPSAQIISTRGTGAMAVNDLVLRTIDRALLTEGSLDWIELRKDLDQEFSGRNALTEARWENYLFPHQNQSARLIAAIDAVTASESK